MDTDSFEGGARRDDDSSWHLDKKVPVGLFLMIMIQTATLIYVGTSWKSDIDHRLTNVEAVAAHDSAQEQAIAILKTQTESTNKTLDRLEALILRVDQKIDQKLQVK